MYEGFRAYLVFNSRDILGPFTPTQAAPATSNIPSCHAEVAAIKHGMMLKRDLKSATLVITRWHFDSQINDWVLADGIPCQSCLEFSLSLVGRFVVSNSDGTLTRITVDRLEELSRPSTGMLYGR